MGQLPYVPNDYIPKERRNFETNVGGVNFGRTECTLEQLELADGNNFELNPAGGFRRRHGNQLWIPNQRFIEYQFVDHAGQDSMGCLIHWATPAGSRRFLAVNTADGLMRRSAWFMCWEAVGFGTIYIEAPEES
jgi:hypothetical protein